MRTVVFGYHTVGVVGIQALIDAGFKIVAVVTHHDNPNENVWFDSVAEKAHSLGVPVLAPDDPNTEELATALELLEPAVVFSFYYRTVLNKRILNIFRSGAYNLHGSMLPAYRGCAPINWQILKGETTLGVTLHRMTPKIDGGEIICQLPLPIGADDTALAVFDKMLPVMKAVLARSLPKILNGTVTGFPQDATKASYFGRRKPDDGRLHFAAMSALEMYNLMRAVAYPWPGTFCFHEEERVKVQWLRPAPSAAGAGSVAAPPGQVLRLDPLTIACREGAVELLEVGEPLAKLGGAAWARRRGVAVGTQFR